MSKRNSVNRTPFNGDPGHLIQGAHDDRMRSSLVQWAFSEWLSQHKGHEAEATDLFVKAIRQLLGLDPVRDLKCRKDPEFCRGYHSHEAQGREALRLLTEDPSLKDYGDWCWASASEIANSQPEPEKGEEPAAPPQEPPKPRGGLNYSLEGF